MSDTESARDNGDECFLSRKQICVITGLSYPTLWAMICCREFPPARRISRNRVAWLKSEIVGWMRACPIQNYKPRDAATNSSSHPLVAAPKSTRRVRDPP
jgi:predicted DNA-binding transcriptional regulator AlpA